MTPSKRIFLINQYFYPDMAATSQLLGDLARWLGSKGWDVVAITGRGSYAENRSVKHVSSTQPWPGVSVRRVWCTDFGRRTLPGRLCDYLTFLLSAAVAVASFPKPDVVVCLSTPPFVAVLGLIAQMKGSRLVYKVEDLYPDVAVALSTLNERSLLTRLLSRLSHFLVQTADRIVTLDRAMAQRLEAAGAHRVATIPNWADGDAIRPDPQAGKAFRQAQDLNERFVVLYSGNLGLAHRFDAVVEAAKQCLVEIPEVIFLFVGGGGLLRDMQKAAEGLSNVRFMDYRSREQLNELYNAADLHLVTLRDEVAGLLSPSKYPAALAAGKPVLLVGGNGAPLQQEIKSNFLGWVCTHDEAAVTDAIREACAHQDTREAMGKRARRIFEMYYSKTTAMRQWEELLNSVLNEGLSETADADIGRRKNAASVQSV